MVGGGAGDRGAALNRVQAAHRHIARFDGRPPARGEVARVAKMRRAAAEEVGIEREHNIRGREVEYRVNRFAEREAGTFVLIIAVRRFELIPGSGGEVLLKGAGGTCELGG